MAEKKPIIRVNFVKVKETGYKLSEAELKKLVDRDLKNLEGVGGKHIVAGDCNWSDGKWAVFSISEWTDIEALQKHVKFEEKEGWFRYFEMKSYLGTRRKLH